LGPFEKNCICNGADSSEEVIARKQVTVRTIDGPMLRRVREKFVRHAEYIKACRAYLKNLL